MKKTKSLLVPVVLLLSVGLCSAAALLGISFWSYEKNVISVPYPITAEVLEDFGPSISPLENQPLRVLLTNVNSGTRTLYLYDNSTFTSGVGWSSVQLNGTVPLGTPFDYNWGDPIVLATGENHILIATISASDNIGSGTNVIRITGSYE